MKAETNCPIRNTHSRLKQAHLAWHETFEAYPDADEFCRRLNTVIPTLRSITWMLQKEKHGDPDFETWFGAKQEEMRADSVLRWLIEARNHIEKRGDLEPHSTAVATLVSGALESVPLRLEVPPIASPEDIANLVRAGLGEDLPERMKKDMTLRVERRWVLTDLPELEVMEALAYCYGRLALIVAEAHERRGVKMRTFGGETHEGKHGRELHPAGKLPCMTASSGARTVHWGLNDDMLLSVETRKIATNPEDLERVRSRYPHMIAPRIDAGAGPEEIGAALHEWGKQILATDDLHYPFAFFITDDGMEIATFEPEDAQSKAVMMEQIALLVDQYGASTLIFSTEVWGAPALPPGDPRARLPARERADRDEAFLTYALSRDGTAKNFITPIHRQDGEPGRRITLGETQRHDLTGPHPFARVMKIWRSWPSPSKLD